MDKRHQVKNEGGLGSFVTKISTNRKGLGFATDPRNNIPEGISSKKSNKKFEDIVIERNDLNYALNGDKVKVMEKNGKYFVSEIIKRARDSFVGIVSKEGGKTVIIPDDRKMYTNIDIDSEKDSVKENQKVLVKINSWTNQNDLPKGKIIKIIGQKGQNDVEMESIVIEKGFEANYPEGVVKEAQEIEKTQKEISAEEIKKRRDFRSTMTFTIDPYDAKDFDDAISFKKISENKYEVGVHIADVSYYVKENSSLDREAFRRGCSVYLVDRTIPMLPEILSNDICSLNPHEEKLTFSAVFILDDLGNIQESWFGRTIIKSCQRFTYESAQDVIDRKTSGGYCEKDSQPNATESQIKEYFEPLSILNKIAKRIREEKIKNGAIEFEQEEVKFRLDKDGKPIGVYKKERIDTHKLVEEYMLLANKEVARFIFKNVENKIKNGLDAASIYRIHDIPDKEKVANLAILVQALGYHLNQKGGIIAPKDINKLLVEIEDTPHESLIRTAAVRSMQKAVYSTKNIGHFGLAFDFYTHFTSPIRRYPDLFVHRILSKHLCDKLSHGQDIAAFEKIAEHSTEREILASEAERESKKLKQVEYMSDRIGKEFTGIISGVSEWGIYIEEKDTKCEGMVRMSSLSDIETDYYEFDQHNYRIVGRKTKKTFTLGDTVKFKVMNADTERRTLDYALVK